jgi:hypothetical protein
VSFESVLPRLSTLASGSAPDEPFPLECAHLIWPHLGR